MLQSFLLIYTKANGLSFKVPFNAIKETAVSYRDIYGYIGTNCFVLWNDFHIAV